jgi:hypothetical protein
MTPNDQNYIRVRPHLDFFSFFEVSHEDDDGENNQEDIEAYDWDGSIDRRHRSNVEGRRAVIDVGSYYFFHRERYGSTIQVYIHPYRERDDN